MGYHNQNSSLPKCLSGIYLQSCAKLSNVCVVENIDYFHILCAIYYVLNVEILINLTHCPYIVLQILLLIYFYKVVMAVIDKT